MVLGLLVLLQSATVDPSTKPPIIDTIIIDNHNIFDGDDASPDWVANLANRLHMRTRQGVIRRRLLLNRGDRFDFARMEESERALRNLGVFRQVRVDTVRQADDRLALRAVTADGWSTQPQASFTSAGGDNTWSLGLTERNFFGTATEVSLVYARDPDRTHLDFEFINPHFFGRRTLLTVRYHDLSDGRLSEWQFGLPFHETAAPHSVETYGNFANERILQFRNGVIDTIMHHELLRVGLTGGVAVSATSHHYTRIWGGWEWRREDYAPMDAAIPYSAFTTVRAGFEVGSVRFRVFEHFNTYARREDVDLSPTLRAGVVLENGVGYEVSAQASTVWDRGFAELRLAANGLDTTRTLGQLTIVSQNIGRHTFIAHAEGGVTTNPLPGAEFDPWIYQRGPRLFGIHDFTGTRTTLFVLEDRMLVADNVLGLMAFGLAPFVDYGGAWYADQPSRQGGNAGVSVRFGPTRAVKGDVAEVAVGYRFGQGMSGKRWALTVRKALAF